MTSTVVAITGSDIHSAHITSLIAKHIIGETVVLDVNPSQLHSTQAHLPDLAPKKSEALTHKLLGGEKVRPLKGHFYSYFPTDCNASLDLFGFDRVVRTMQLTCDHSFILIDLGTYTAPLVLPAFAQSLNVVIQAKEMSISEIIQLAAILRAKRNNLRLDIL